MRHRSAVGVLASLALAGCGYVGDPLPPALNVPLPIQDLSGIQRGDKVILGFTPSLRSTDGVILKSLRSIDLRGGEIPEGGLQLDAWAASARVISVAGAGAEYAEVSVPVEGWPGKEVAFAVRTVGPTGRASWWSNVLILRIVTPPETPKDLRVEGEAGGVRLTWLRGAVPEGSAWRIWRKAQDEAEPSPAGESEEASWLDSSARFGTRYDYAAQTLVPANERKAESLVSPAQTILYEDKYPPAVPTGLEAVAGVNSIELVWDRGAEADLAAWQIWRAEGNAQLQKYGTPAGRPSFSDTRIESGKRYRYAVSAVDEKGNESQPSPSLEVIAP